MGVGGGTGELLHVSLLGELKVPDGFPDIVEQSGSAGVGHGVPEDIAADGPLSEGHAARIVRWKDEEKVTLGRRITCCALQEGTVGEVRLPKG